MSHSQQEPSSPGKLRLVLSAWKLFASRIAGVANLARPAFQYAPSELQGPGLLAGNEGLDKFSPWIGWVRTEHIALAFNMHPPAIQTASRESMKFRRAMCAASALLLISCTGTPVQQGPLIVQIGQAGPLTGPQAAYGIDLQHGAQLAVDDLNSANVLIGGRQATFVLVPEDDGANERQAELVAKRLVEKKVAGVVGHLNAMASISAFLIYARAGIPAITPSATHPMLTGMGLKTAFRLQPNNERVAFATAQYVISLNPGAKYAVIDDGQAYGENAARMFEAALIESGRLAVIRSSVPSDSVDFHQEVERLKQSQANVLFFGALDDQVGPMVKQLWQTGLDTIVVSADGACTSHAVSLAGNAVLDGKLICGEPADFPPQIREGLAKFKHRLRERHPGALPVYSSSAYDAVKLMAAAMVKAGSSEPAKYLPFLASTAAYKGVAGDVTFDRHGDNADATISIFHYSERKKTVLAQVH